MRDVFSKLKLLKADLEGCRKTVCERTGKESPAMSNKSRKKRITVFNAFLLHFGKRWLKCSGMENVFIGVHLGRTARNRKRFCNNVQLVSDCM